MMNKIKKLGITALACVVSLTTAGTVANLVNSGNNGNRSEERRVGKECLRLCRSRWSPYH